MAKLLVWHIIFTDHGSTGDGVIAALSVLGLLKRSGQPLSQIRNVMSVVPQVLKNVRVNQKPALETVPVIHEHIQKVKAKLGDSGRLLVRYSGTEPLCRVMIEGEDNTLIHSLADDLVSTIQKALAS